MAKECNESRRQRPREPLPLRRALGFRRAGETKLSAALENPSEAHPARTQAEYSPTGKTFGQKASTSTKSTEISDETAYAAWSLNNELFLQVAAKTADPIGQFPGGPDYSALKEIITGLAKQSERHRHQWRKRHDKDLTAPAVKAKQETKELYAERGRSLLGAYIRTNAPGVAAEDVEPRDFADWLLALKPLWDENTWRLYRAGAHDAIQRIPSAYAEEALGWLYSDLSAERKARQDDPRRVDRMDEGHFKKLKLQLGLSNSNLARHLDNWLDAGIHTGVSPAQWPLCSLETRPDSNAPRGERIWLHVITGQVQEGWLVHRTLEVTGFSETTLEAIRKMIKNARDWARDGKFSARQGEVARLLRKTSRWLFPRMQLQYDLHSLRHQFIENMRSKYNDAEVAALVGQPCLNKGKKNYINRRPEWKKIDEVPLPSPRLVKRMENRLRIHSELRELKELKEDFRRSRAQKGDD